MTAQDLLPLAIAVPLLGSVLLALAGRRLSRLGCDILATGVAALELAVLVLLRTKSGSIATADLGGWPAQVGIVLAADPLGAGLALLVGVLVLAVIIYSWRYFDEPTGERTGILPALILLFEAGMAGFALTGDLFNAFVFFELMGAAAYALTGYRIEDPRPLHGALTFAIVNSFAAYCSLLGIGLLYARTGELNLARLGERLADHHTDALTVVSFVLVCTALLVKAAAVPFHFWLPDAHAVAPTPVCMLMSGVMVELGVYGIARVYWTVFSGPGGIPHEAFRSTVTALGVVTALLGALMCWQQRHLKRLLAFSTISHVGLFLIGIAVLTSDGAGGTALYVGGHGLVKAALFGLAGVLLDRYGSVDEHGLHGKARDLRAVGVLFVVGALALAGLPPFGTGLGKALTEDAAGHLQSWLPAVFVATSAVTGAAVLRAALRIFFGVGPVPGTRPGEEETTGEGEEPEIRDAERTLPPAMLAVPALLLTAALILGCAPAVATALAQGAQTFTDPARYTAAVTEATGSTSAPGAAGGSLDRGGPRPRPTLRHARLRARRHGRPATHTRRPRSGGRAGAAPPALRTPRRLPRLARPRRGRPVHGHRHPDLTRRRPGWRCPGRTGPGAAGPFLPKAGRWRRRGPVLALRVNREGMNTRRAPHARARPTASRAPRQFVRRTPAPPIWPARASDSHQHVLVPVRGQILPTTLLLPAVRPQATADLADLLGC